MLRRKIWAIVFLSGALALGSAPAFAQASRTWVSGVGDDANPCSRTAPCKTFAGAISKTAPAGEINVIDPGGFGAVTITKSITIDGGPFTAGVLSAGTNGIIVNAPGIVVRLRNLDIDGVGTGVNGVNFLQGAALEIENTQIYGFSGVGISVAPTAVQQMSLVVRNSSVTDSVNGGILLQPAIGGGLKADIVGVTSSRNKFGLRVTDGAFASVKDGVFSNNTFNGLLAASSGGACEINAERSMVSNNGQHGVDANGAGAIVRISGLGIFNNAGNGIAPLAGGQVISFGTNQNAGNGTNGAPSSSIPSQ